MRKYAFISHKDSQFWIEINIPVYCVDMIGDSWAIDEKKDLKIVEERLIKNKK